MKICSKCKREKNFDEFCKKKDSKDGLSFYCKECRSINSKVEYINNKEQKIKYYKQNIERKKKIDYDYRIRNDIREKRNKYLKEYNQKYKKALNEYHRKRRSFKYKTDINFKLTCILRARLSQALKGRNKIVTTFSLLGCNIDELKMHLEKQFSNDMSWQNHGIIWEIDHIVGCCNFDLTYLEQQKQCFHFSNLQPLYKLQNRQKPKRI